MAASGSTSSTALHSTHYASAFMGAECRPRRARGRDPQAPTERHEEAALGSVRLMADSARPREFRIGVLRERDGTGDFRSLAKLSFSADGGVIAAPGRVPGAKWRYALSEGTVNRPASLMTVEGAPPKLHYHRSGMVSVNRTGSSDQRLVMHAPPLPEQQVAQILSVAGVRPWELEARGARAGDVMLFVEQWPDVVSAAVSIYAIPAETSLVYHPGFPPAVGLVPDDPHQFIVDLRAKGIDAVVCVDIAGASEAELAAQHSWMFPILEPGIAVVAVPWTARQGTSAPVLSLWSDTLRNPPVFLLGPDRHPPLTSFAAEALEGRAEPFVTRRLGRRDQATP